ncbi:MAG: nuclear transport factor 2 family protein [Chloroflexi bacterium]|nr:nuclear transport factor 2 family protein [Chloroflexota bacterium]
MSSDAANQTEATLNHHIESVGTKDIDAIMQDYSDDSVLVTPDVSIEGLDGIRGFFEAFLPGLTAEIMANFAVDRAAIHDELAYIVWNAGDALPLGTDTFIVRNSKIRFQTFAAYMGD